MTCFGAPAPDVRSCVDAEPVSRSCWTSMASDQPLLALENVSITFGPQRVLANIALRIPKGQTVAVIGESGCGKTVLLKLLIGLIKPTLGRVLFDGRNLAELSDRDLTQARLRYGFLFQGAALFD